MDVSVFGLGYVGTVAAVVLAADGHRVTGVDVNEGKVRAVNAGQSPIVEPGVDEMLRCQVQQRRLRATLDVDDSIRGSEISLICVGTPSRRNGGQDLSHLQRVCDQIGAALRAKSTYHIIVVRSTVLPGTTQQMVIPSIERASGKKYGQAFGVSVNPEFLREGSAIDDFKRPPVTLIGHNHVADATGTAALYASTPAPCITTSVAVAETVKYVANSWHALKVCFANEVGSVCQQIGVDGRRVMEIFCQDEKLNLSGRYLRPGFAFGGSCLPKDVRALQHLARGADVETPVIHSILASNRLQIQRGIDHVLETGKMKVGLLGLSFKAGTDDLRESPYVILAETLLGKGRRLRIYDADVSVARIVGSNRCYIEEQIPHLAALLCTDARDVLDDADVVVVGKPMPGMADVLARTRPDQIVFDLVPLTVERALIPAEYHPIC
jgi:GDP-mannose 6-dehydrogenase